METFHFLFPVSRYSTLDFREVEIEDGYYFRIDKDIKYVQNQNEIADYIKKKSGSSSL